MLASVCSLDRGGNLPADAEDGEGLEAGPPVGPEATDRFVETDERFLVEIVAIGSGDVVVALEVADRRGESSGQLLEGGVAPGLGAGGELGGGGPAEVEIDDGGTGLGCPSWRGIY